MSITDARRLHVATDKAYPSVAMLSLIKGGWRGRCDCGWLAPIAHRSELEADKDCRKHVRGVSS